MAEGPSQSSSTTTRTPRLAKSGAPTSGVSNGTTNVTVVGSPAVNTVREVVVLTAVNLDTVSHVFIFTFYDGTTDREFYRSETVNSLLSMVPYELPVFLNATTHLLKMKMLEAKTTTESDFTAMYKDHT